MVSSEVFLVLLVFVERQEALGGGLLLLVLLIPFGISTHFLGFLISLPLRVLFARLPLGGLLKENFAIGRRSFVWKEQKRLGNENDNCSVERLCDKTP